MKKKILSIILSIGLLGNVLSVNVVSAEEFMDGMQSDAAIESDIIRDFSEENVGFWDDEQLGNDDGFMSEDAYGEKKEDVIGAAESNSETLDNSASVKEKMVTATAKRTEENLWCIEIEEFAGKEFSDERFDFTFPEEMQDVLIKDGKITFKVVKENNILFTYYDSMDSLSGEKVKTIVEVVFSDIYSEGYDRTDGFTDLDASSTDLIYGDYKYKVSQNEATITGYTGSQARLSIPEEIANYKVTTIGSEAFKGCEGIVYVNIPDTVKSIGIKAFSNCVNLKEIILPEGLKKIEQGFIENTAVTSLIVPSTVEYGGYNSVNGGTNGANALKRVVFADGMKKIPNYICANSSENTVLIEIVIPESVEEIGKYAFKNCNGIENIFFEKNISKIDEGAFTLCKNLKKIEFEQTDKYYPTVIDASVFSKCTGLEEVILTSNVTEIGTRAFEYCNNLTRIELPEGVEKVGIEAFRNCINLKEIILSEGLKRIEQGFIQNTAITSLTVPSTVEYGGYNSSNGAINGANALKKVVFADGMKRIPNYICANSSENSVLDEIEIPKSVEEIGKYAFKNCSGIKNVFFKEVSKIDEGAFALCKNLKRIEFEKSDKYFPSVIEESAFSQCTGLEKVVLTSDITEIGTRAFEYCNNLTQIELPEGVEKVGIEAFRNCINLKKIILPKGLKWIGQGFIQNTAVTSLTVPSTVEYGGYNNLNGATNGANALTEVVFTDGMKKIPKYFCANSSENTVLVKATIPESVEEIGTNVFRNCTAVEIYGYKDSYAEKYAEENNIPFVVNGYFVKELKVESKFENNLQRKDLHWTSDGYSEKELHIKIQVSGRNVQINSIEVELNNLKMFKVDGASKTRNVGNDYFYTINENKKIEGEEKSTFEITLVKKGLTWWKPNDKELHSGSINFIVTGETENGKTIKNTVGVENQLSIDYQNDIKVNQAIEAEEKAAADAKRDAEKYAKDLNSEFKNLKDKMILDPQIEGYLGHEQFEALKMLIYTEISLANISKSYFTASGLSEEVAELAMKKFLGYEKNDFGIADKTVPIEVVVLGKNNKQYQFEFLCNVQVYSLKGSSFGINGNIITEMWEVARPNKKVKKISCSTGMINEGKIKDFSEGVWKVAEASLKSAYKSVWGNDADKVANGIMESSVNSLASKAAKYGIEKPVHIILESFYKKTLKSKFSEGFFKLLIYPSKKVIAQCPVDIYVYDSANELKGSIENDAVTGYSDGVVLWTEGDDKYIQLFDDSYKIIYKATGTGTMNINIYDQMLNDFNYRNCEFESIPLDTGIEYSQLIDSVLFTDSGNYSLKSENGNVIGISNEQIMYTDTYPSEHVHAWDSGVMTKQANCITEGEMKYTCTVCGESKNEVIKGDHSWTEWKKMSESTVFEPEIQTQTCKVCGATQKKTVGNKLASKMQVSANSLKLQIKQKTKAFRVLDMENGDYVTSVKSSNTKVLKIGKFTKEGSITLKAQNKTGKAKITIILAGGAKKIVPVNVQKGTVKTTKISGVNKKVTLKKGKKLTLHPTIKPITSGQKITYVSSDKKIAAVNAKGVITAKKVGKAKITVKSGSKKIVVTVTVKK